MNEFVTLSAINTRSLYKTVWAIAFNHLWPGCEFRGGCTLVCESGILPDNWAMQALCKDLGFQIRHDGPCCRLPPIQHARSRPPP